MNLIVLEISLDSIIVEIEWHGKLSYNTRIPNKNIRVKTDTDVFDEEATFSKAPIQML